MQRLKKSRRFLELLQERQKVTVSTFLPHLLLRMKISIMPSKHRTQLKQSNIIWKVVG